MALKETLEKLKLGYSPITKSMYLHASKSFDVITTDKIDFEGQVMAVVTNRLLDEEDRSMDFSFGSGSNLKKFVLKLEEVKERTDG